jgi:hypothetical protein
MARFYRVAFMALCLSSLFSVAAITAWADGGGGTVSSPVAGPDCPLFIPAPQNKLPPDGCRFFCLGDYSTAVNGGSSDWGMGSSCEEAQSAFSGAVSSKADSYCQSIGRLWVCSLTEVKGGCFFNGTMMQIDGYADFQCMEEICP